MILNLSKKILFSLAALLSIGSFLPCFAQPETDGRIIPNIIDMKVIVQQHYNKLKYSVLSDTLRETNFTNSKWIVMQDAVVPTGIKLTIPQGVSVYFEPGASLKVDGSLEASGSNAAPIIFTKIDSSDMIKRPSSNTFTWNGISIGKQGRVVLKNVRIEHASKGILSDGLCDSLTIDSADFSKSFPLQLIASNISLNVNSKDPFTLRCPVPKQAKGKSVPAFVKWMYGVGASSALASGVLYLAAYSSDQNAAKSKDHQKAQALYDKATGLYKGSLLSGIVAAGLVAPAIVLQLSF